MPAATEQSEPDIAEIRELETRLDRFRIDTTPDLTIRGSAWEGYAFNCYACDEIPESQGGPPPTPTGACCIDTTCSITTQVGCTSQGGTYQGDNTTCDPNPCGACSICDPILTFQVGCDDGFGNCGNVQNCDGTCGDPQPCDSRWLVLEQRCVGEDVDCAELCVRTTLNPFTCEITEECFSHDCCATCVNGTVNSTSVLYDPCGACCVDGDCTIQGFYECPGDWQGFGTDCDPNPC